MRSAHIECVLFVAIYRALYEAIVADPGTAPRGSGASWLQSSIDRVDSLLVGWFKESTATTTSADLHCWHQTSDELAYTLENHGAFVLPVPQRHPVWERIRCLVSPSAWRAISEERARLAEAQIVAETTRRSATCAAKSVARRRAISSASTRQLRDCSSNMSRRAPRRQRGHGAFRTAEESPVG